MINNVYVDGLNLRHSVSEQMRKHSAYKHKKWYALDRCNVAAMARFFIPRGQQIRVAYYTTHPEHLPAKVRQAHADYMMALKASGVRVVEGKFKNKEFRINPDKISPPLPCRVEKGLHVQAGHAEKDTDINMAVDIMTDHLRGVCDRVVLVSGDSDLLPVVRRVVETAEGKEILVLAPPGQHVSHLQELAASADALSIARITLEWVARCQLP